MRVAVIQSNYLPWKGYFDIIRQVDLFVFYDDVQFTKNDWRNRNRIKTANGVQWLTVPVGKNIHRQIDEVLITESRWQRKHLQAILQSYQKSAHFDYLMPFLKDLFLQSKWTHLADLNQYAIRRIATDFLNCKTDYLLSSDLSLTGSKGERLLHLLKTVGATHYLSGPAARTYLNQNSFDEAGIKLEFIDYSQYQQYEQPFPPFDHHVSIIDLLATHGPTAVEFMMPMKP